MQQLNSGVYQIRNTVNGKVYIGSAKHFNKRKSQHFHYLKTNKHHSQKLQRSYNKYGIQNFVFEISILNL